MKSKHGMTWAMLQRVMLDGAFCSFSCQISIFGRRSTYTCWAYEYLSTPPVTAQTKNRARDSSWFACRHESDMIFSVHPLLLLFISMLSKTRIFTFFLRWCRLIKYLYQMYKKASSETGMKMKESSAPGNFAAATQPHHSPPNLSPSLFVSLHRSDCFTSH